MALKEHEDFVFLPDGRLVFTASYLSARGFCCGNGCLNCPYEYDGVSEPRRSYLLEARRQNRDDDAEQ
jgi:hypothetical protein